MISNNISSNTLFFAGSEQCNRHRGVTTGYKKAFFIPFTLFFIPFYTHIYLTTKHITSTHKAFHPAQQKNINRNSPIFNFIPCKRREHPAT